MSISDRVRTLRAKGYLAQATSNLLEVVASNVEACDGYDEDQNEVILAAEVALRDLREAMTCIVSDGGHRGTIANRDGLTCDLLNAYESIDLAISKTDAVVDVSLETAKLQVRGACNLCSISLPSPRREDDQPEDEATA